MILTVSVSLWSMEAKLVVFTLYYPVLALVRIAQAILFWYNNCVYFVWTDFLNGEKRHNLHLTNQQVLKVALGEIC